MTNINREDELHELRMISSASLEEATSEHLVIGDPPTDEEIEEILNANKVATQPKDPS